jgi:hypothetical protein
MIFLCATTTVATTWYDEDSWCCPEQGCFGLVGLVGRISAVTVVLVVATNAVVVANVSNLHGVTRA